MAHENLSRRGRPARQKSCLARAKLKRTGWGYLMDERRKSAEVAQHAVQVVQFNGRVAYGLAPMVRALALLGDYDAAMELHYHRSIGERFFVGDRSCATTPADEQFQ
jgi:hypothetical protein